MLEFKITEVQSLDGVVQYDTFCVATKEYGFNDILHVISQGYTRVLKDMHAHHHKENPSCTCQSEQYILELLSVLKKNHHMINKSTQHTKGGEQR